MTTKEIALPEQNKKINFLTQKERTEIDDIVDLKIRTMAKCYFTDASFSNG